MVDRSSLHPAALSADGQPGVSSTGWLVVARATWLVILYITLGMFIAGAPDRYLALSRAADERILLQLGISARAYATYLVGLSLLVVLLHAAIAWVIFMRRRDEWIALFVAFSLVTSGATFPLTNMAAPAGLTPGAWDFLVSVVVYTSLFFSMALLYLFPDGRFYPRWTRWLAAVWAVALFFAIFLPESALSLKRWPVLAQVIILLGLGASGAFAQARRFYRVSSALQRQQTKWALLGLAAAVVGPFFYFTVYDLLPTLGGAEVPNLLFQRAGASFFAVAMVVRLVGFSVIAFLLLLFPISFAIAILRYRLWDIDLLLRRTLVYAALTTSLAFIYFVSVVLLQEVVRSVTGESQTELVTVVSTLGIASLFNPLRRRIQANIDRRFYRRHYDAQRTLESFAHQIRDEVDIERLSAAILSIVDNTMQPDRVTLWLSPRDGQPLALVSPSRDDATASEGQAR